MSLIFQQQKFRNITRDVDGFYIDLFSIRRTLLKGIREHICHPKLSSLQ